jgi:hypothetical protein
MRLTVFGTAVLSWAVLSAALTDTIYLSGDTYTGVTGSIHFRMVNSDGVEVCGYSSNGSEDSGKFGCGPDITASFSELTGNDVLITYHSKCGLNVDKVKVSSSDLNCWDCCGDEIPCNCCVSKWSDVKVGSKSSKL